MPQRVVWAIGAPRSGTALRLELLPNRRRSFIEHVRSHRVFGAGSDFAPLVANLVLEDRNGSCFRRHRTLHLLHESRLATFEGIVEIDQDRQRVMVVSSG